ncbi:MAG: hypothetical protein Q9227_002421 [Pyrenula ochraceoflavens]
MSALQPILRSSNAVNTQPLLSLPSRVTYIHHSHRTARLLRRPKRPYTFTQLITLSDGSAYTIRTTSPFPVYRSARDTRNAPLWNPSSRELLNVEADEAGRLAAFRARFGRGWDASKESSMEGRKKDEREAMNEEEKQAAQDLAVEEEDVNEEDESLLDLISSYGQNAPQPKGDVAVGRKNKKR